MHRKIYFLFLLTISIVATDAAAQGCVAIRHFSSCTGSQLENNLLGAGEWQVGLNYRYFKSFRHFRGTYEEPDRVANGSEVINHSHGWDFSVTRGLTDRLYASLTLPYVINTRSSLYEHGREERNTTFSRGIADARLGLGFWLFAPAEHAAGNVALGLGVKLPTGDYQATDIFYNVGADGAPQVRPVDQSIQPGDGGFGLTFDFQAYQRLGGQFYAYAGGFYLLNPRETNGVRTFRETLSPILQNEAVMSVPDQYSLRGGLSLSLPDLHTGLSLGARYEGVPVEDLVGGSAGFRRPGTVLSVEPGVQYMRGNTTLTLNVPVALRRNRPQSLTDLETQQATGNPRNGDAAFADYLINVGIAVRLPGQAAGRVPDWETINRGELR